MALNTRTAEGLSAFDLPRLAAGSYENRRVVFLRADHLAAWLDDVEEAVSKLVDAGDPVDAGVVVEEIAGMIREAAR